MSKKKNKKIRAIIRFQLVFPYKLAMWTLVEFCRLWDCTLVSGGTKKLNATISMPANYFKKIFGENPRKQEYPIPSGMEHFIESVEVKKVLTK
jgi:hypothetical protein